MGASLQACSSREQPTTACDHTRWTVSLFALRSLPALVFAVSRRPRLQSSSKAGTTSLFLKTSTYKAVVLSHVIVNRLWMFHVACLVFI